ncbi:hypothetical protein Poli38472_003999 [Pythium oligandrum]|uniref:SAM domain-containing protein n=1 Tax=Pythium oligandrum TaxID=41045 RepID=A0A8K1CMI9_PYTOL|nr:hypothetical protein Poli38472_003999 [Pythium oligandrum]|eukprot:TMW66234.1 hypothetical protein Poli38472_003999 [Pythium oligandrum]
MDWEANLAAIIKHTDANLEQQFRQFADLSGDLDSFQSYLSEPTGFGTTTAASSSHSHPRATSEHGNFANTFLRESLGTMHAAQRQGTVPSSFATHFRQRQERKHDVPGRRYETGPENNARSGGSKEDARSESEEEVYYQDMPQQSQRRRSHRGSNSYGGLSAQQVFGGSSSYDMAQMMEQIRLSLKLEVDARAAIAERQLSALLQLCKATSEELDRLRIEVCATDRQLHTIDQVQAKMRQELTTQKDIGFHLQSMCGKDESWRVQADNQLLELRQLVAALREHGNSVQMQVQEKLSRQELLVQFNAAIEPIKAQFQATLQHQAQQLAEVTRTSSSSTLLLDALTQKVNRVQSDEIVELRNELQAVKSLVSRFSGLENRPRSTDEKAKGRKSRGGDSDEDTDDENFMKKQKKARDAIVKDVTSSARQELAQLVQSELEARLAAHTASIADLVKHEIHAVRSDFPSLARQCQEGLSALERRLTTHVDAQVKQTEQSVHSDLLSQLRDQKDRFDQQLIQGIAQQTSVSETRITSLQTCLQEMGKSVEADHRECKQSVERVAEDLRKTRHKLEEHLHRMGIEQRTKVTVWNDELSQKQREMERKMGDLSETTQKEVRQFVEVTQTKIREEMSRQSDDIAVKWKTLEEKLLKIEHSQAEATAAAVAASMEANKATETRVSVPVASSNETQTQSQLAAIDTTLQKMMMQLQLQQQQQQMQLALQSTVSAVYPPSIWSQSSAPPTPMAAASQTPRPARVEPATIETSAVVEKEGKEAALVSARIAKHTIEEKPLATAEKALSEPTPEELKLDEIISRVVTDELPRRVSKPEVKPEAPRPPLPPAPLQMKTEEPTSSTNQTSSSSSPAVDVLAKAQQVMASTAKGAVAEAEMAKLRVEARRKQELEARQQAVGSGSIGPPSILTRSVSASSLDPAVPSKTDVANTGIADGKGSPMLRTRSNSVNDISLSFLPPPEVPPPPASAARPPPIKIPEASSIAQSKPPPPPPSVPPAVPPSPLVPRPVSSALELKTPLPPSPSPPAQVVSPPAPALAEAKTPSPSETVPKPQAPPAAVAPSPSVSHVLCEQCRLPVRSDLLSDHMQRQCIKRTERCGLCENSFLWSERETHERDCPRRSTGLPSSPSLETPSSGSHTDLVGSKKCRHCSTDVPGGDLFEHELRCDQMLKQCPHCLRRQKMVELQEHIENCDCRLVPCPYDCGGKFLQRGIDKHLATRCPKRPAGASTTTATPTTPSATSTTSVAPSIAQPAVAVPINPAPTPSIISASGPPKAQEKAECKFCDEEFNTRELDAHENNCDWKPRRCQHCNMVIIARDLIRHESSCKTSTKNCPHCNESMPQAALTGHTSRCSKRPIKCIRCCQLFPADAIVAHSSNCKFLPSSASQPSVTAATPAQSITSGSATGPTTRPPSSIGQTSATTPLKIPPPPPYPPSTTTTTGATVAQSINRAPPPASSAPAKTTVSEEANVADRLARRNLALSQLTGQASPATAASIQREMSQTSTTATRVLEASGHPEVAEDDDEDEDDEEEEDDEDDDDQLTLAQVVAEWSVENVCLWLHEDVGVPEVVPRFQQRQCNGEMLLDLTESDLINDFGIKNRLHRERILSAIDAIKTSDDFSDEDEDDDDDLEDEEEEEEEEEHGTHAVTSASHSGSTRRPSLDESSFLHPRDLLRRNSLPSPQNSPLRASASSSSNSTLPSSSAMLRRINSALNVEFPSSRK